MSTFKTGIIDPPWPYTAAPGKKEKDKGTKSLSGFVQTPDGKDQYPVLSIEEMCALPIGDLIDSYLFMWTTMPFFPAALKMYEAWGFEYKTGMCWGKWDVSKQTNSPRLFELPVDYDFNMPGNGGYGGVGFWFLGNHELVLIGKKHGAPSIRTGESSLFLYPKTKHSEKPDRVHRLCEKYFPKEYVEIFGRRARAGWTVLGNEAPGDGKDIRDSLTEQIKRSTK